MHRLRKAYHIALALLVSATLAAAALLKCPDCGTMVSSRATACPKCGCPVTAMSSDAGRFTQPSEPRSASFDSVRMSLVLVKTKNGVGSGFVARMDGKLYVITNAHVLHDANELSLTTLTGTTLPWLSIELAHEDDLARILLQSTPSGVAPLAVSTTELGMNQPVLVYGDSQGSGVATELRGKIIGVGPKTLETDAEFVRGNSGSPILDAAGEVVGVATFVTRTAPGTDWVADNTRFTLTRRFGVRLRDLKWVPVEQEDLQKQVALLLDVDEFLADIFSLIPNWHPAVSSDYRYAARDALHMYSAERQKDRYRNPAWAKAVDRFCDLYVASSSDEWKRNLRGMSNKSFAYTQAEREQEKMVSERDQTFLSFAVLPEKAMVDTRWLTKYLEDEAKSRRNIIDFLKECIQTIKQSSSWGRYVSPYHSSFERTPNVSDKR